ncbi:MAG: NMT1/THI5 like protein [Pelotomaculum sp. PtaU1.Bin035]|nr:MAG: NMT1/THI5 like protein [Pelotomaculum sp. PtaU1.Bin035]
MGLKLKISISIILLVLLVIFIRHSSNMPDAVQETHTVRVMESARSPYFLPQYLALNLGFFKEQNLDVNITTTSPEAIRTALADHRTDVALCGLQKIIFNPDKPNDGKSVPKVFAAIALRDGSLLLARKDVADFQWQKLDNKTIIGGSQDDSSEIALESVLRHIGLTLYRNVTIYHNIPESLRIGAFRAGTGNYLQLLEPEATIAESKGFGKVVASIGEAAGNMFVTAYAALPEYIEAQPEIVQKFTNAIYKAQLWLKQHSSEEAAAAVSLSFPNVDKQVLLKSIERYRSLEIWAENPVVSREPYEKFHAAARNAGEIAAPAPYETTVINSFARQAVETVVYVPKLEKSKKKSFLTHFNRLISHGNTGPLSDDF